MTDTDERTVLTQLLQAVENDTTHARWERQATVLHYVAGTLIFGVTLWALSNRHDIEAPQVVALVVALVAGAVLGAMKTLERMTANSRIVCRYIDVEKVRARLAQVANDGQNGP